MDAWRPKDGVYAVTGRGFNDRCLEFGDTSIDWKNNSINGGEEECKINRTTDTAPGELRLDLTCTDIERPTPHTEIIQLKKINETTLFLRETQNGKFGRRAHSLHIVLRQLRKRTSTLERNLSKRRFSGELIKRRRADGWSRDT